MIADVVLKRVPDVDAAGIACQCRTAVGNEPSGGWFCSKSKLSSLSPSDIMAGVAIFPRLGLCDDAPEDHCAVRSGLVQCNELKRSGAQGPEGESSLAQPTRHSYEPVVVAWDENKPSESSQRTVIHHDRLTAALKALSVVSPRRANCHLFTLELQHIANMLRTCLPCYGRLLHGTADSSTPITLAAFLHRVVSGKVPK
jgi:hypothetical protein